MVDSSDPATIPVEFFGCGQEHLELQAEILDAASRVLTGGKVLQGPDVAQFESSIAEQCGRRHAVAVGSGTDALFFALVAADVGVGDEVLVPDFSFLASASAILRLGARPVFVDVGPDCTLDLDRAAASVTARTRALVHVQLFGGMAAPAAVEQFAADHDLILVEDFAQSFGAGLGGRRAGSMGLAGAVSFDPTKVLGAPGSGGAVVTDDDAVCARVRRLRYHGKEGGAFVELGYNSQMPSLTAAILSLKLARFESWRARRTQTAQHYLKAFEPLPLGRPLWPDDVRHVWHKFVVQTPHRDALAAYLAGQGVATAIHYATPFHREPLFGPSGDDEDFPESSRLSRQSLSLPIHSHLRADEVERVAAAVTAFFSRP
ncbi:MAG: DegT/DnrJ/EryC1/StrS family aminotransferase [Phenylobacterium sp.]|nr:DegT/DnrJ/EryC1/StrS family aminotransferase [Phenylobacterium sp.]